MNTSPNRPLTKFPYAQFVVVFFLSIVGCGSSQYPQSRFREMEIPAGVPSELVETVQRLNSREPLTRAHAARQLGEQAEADEAVITCLLAALQDENLMVRGAAAESLGTTGSARAVAPLIKRMRDRQEDREVRSRAAEALGRLGAVEAVDVLIAALNDTVWHIRLHAVQALAAIGDPAAVTSIELVAHFDPDYSIRAAAEEALRSFEVGQDVPGRSRSREPSGTDLGHE